MPSSSWGIPDAFVQRVVADGSSAETSNRIICALDIDNTLICNGDVCPNAIRALSACSQHANETYLVTARNQPFVADLLQAVDDRALKDAAAAKTAGRDSDGADARRAAELLQSTAKNDNIRYNPLSWESDTTASDIAQTKMDQLRRIAVTTSARGAEALVFFADDEPTTIDSCRRIARSPQLGFKLICCSPEGCA